MNRQEAIKALVMAGRSKEVEQLIERKIGEANSFYADIRSDGSRTDEYKKWQIADAYEGYYDDITNGLVTLAKTAGRADQVDAKSVFGVDDLPGDAASRSISRRDAGDRVAAITNPGELQQLLARATRSGDEILARAVAERALEMRDAKTLEKFAEDRPNVDAAVERLWKIQQRRDAAGSAPMQAALMMANLKPAELGDMDTGSIRALANSPEPSNAPKSYPPSQFVVTPR